MSSRWREHRTVIPKQRLSAAHVADLRYQLALGKRHPAMIRDWLAQASSPVQKFEVRLCEGRFTGRRFNKRRHPERAPKAEHLESEAAFSERRTLVFPSSFTRSHNRPYRTLAAKPLFLPASRLLPPRPKAMHFGHLATRNARFILFLDMPEVALVGFGLPLSQQL